MKALSHRVALFALVLLGANACAAITEVDAPGVPSERPRASLATVAEASPGNPAAGGDMASEKWTARFLTILGFVLLFVLFVCVLTSARRVAMASAACLASLAQLTFLSTETWDALDLEPLYPHVVLRVLSCGLVAGLAAASVSFHMRPGRPPGAGHLLLAMAPASLAALFLFELLYFTSRMPAISPVSLSLSLRPMARLANPTLAVFIAVWLLSVLCLLGDSTGSGSGQDEAPDGTQRPVQS